MPAPSESSPWLRRLWLLLFVLAATLWSVQIGRPVDLPNWHEFDYSSIARNFLHEGNNILYPRIDWRGDGPGFTEMEFPIIPWAMAQIYRSFGTNELVGRIFSYVFTLLSLAVFAKLALKFLPQGSAIVACLFFVVAHVITLVATAIQPEALMLLLYLLAVDYFVDWYDSQSRFTYALAVAAFACAMLVKLPAAHLAIFFLLWALHNDGLRAFRRPSLYLFAILSFAPAVFWYGHASSLWHQFHNSMGVSNEDHWFGLDMLKRPKVIANLFSIDFLLVGGGGGLVIAVLGFARYRLRSEVNRLAVYWCMAIAVYLVVIMRTSAAYWAAYYHVILVPPVALLFASGLTQLGTRGSFSLKPILLWGALSTVMLASLLFVLGKRDSSHWPGVFQDLVSAHTSLAVFLVLAILSFGLTVLCIYLGNQSEATRDMPLRHSWPLLIAACFSYFFLSGQMLLGTWKTFATRTPQFNAAMSIKEKLEPGALIIASGGVCFDAGGHRVANDAPNMFYWLDRKGFTTCQGRESIAELKDMRVRGAQYYVADKADLAEEPGFEAELRKSFVLLADSDTELLFRLRR